MSESIELNHIAKVEGHAHLTVEIKDGKLIKCNLQAIEGARFFEGIVVGKHYEDVKEITSRICGICSVAHAIASLQAVEAALGVEITEQTKRLRELMVIGERIRSHATHLFFLSLPDFLGYESALEMAPKYQEEVQMALDLMKAGNLIVQKTGGRQMHPVSCVVGGFTHVPSDNDREYLRELLETARPGALKTLELFLGFTYPDIHQDVEHMSLRQEGSFPLIRGRVMSDRGLDVDPHDYDKHIQEYLTPYATSKFAVKDGKTYLVGALARMNTNWHMLAKDVKEKITAAGIVIPSKNPFHNLVAQAAELVHWLDVGLYLVSQPYTFEGLPTPKARKGRGVSATEAPRGILYHDYSIDEQGLITNCNIITPTVQNLANMEADIKTLVEKDLQAGLKKDDIVMDVEKLIRAYDPCFSCSTHFLQVDWSED